MMARSLKIDFDNIQAKAFLASQRGKAATQKELVAHPAAAGEQRTEMNYENLLLP